jgi:hypothetical protein
LAVRSASRRKKEIAMRPGLIAFILCLIIPAMGATETDKQREQQESFQKYLDAKLYEVNQKLDSLGSKAGEVKEDFRKEYRLQTEELAKKRQFVNQKMAEMKSATGVGWDRLKAEVAFAIDDLNRMYDKMSSLLKR